MGGKILNPSFFGSQKEVSLRLDKNLFLTEERLNNMTKHRSLRIDNISFRGRPLGHRIDPFRSILQEMESELFQDLVRRLLEEHKYQIEEEIDAVSLSSTSLEDTAKLLYGTMHYTYEWVYQITTQFASNGNDIKKEGIPNFVQGKCAVLIHSKKAAYPEVEKLKELIEEISKKNMDHFLIFVNLDLIEDESEYIGQTVSAYGQTNLNNVQLKPKVLGLGEISFTLLISTLVYLNFRDKISFKLVNYLCR